jgi:hypothetical protein
MLGQHLASASSRRGLLGATARSSALLATASLLPGGAVAAQGAAAIAGSWLVTTADPTPSIVGIVSHTEDGVVIQAHPNPALSAGHGAWVQTGERDYLLTFLYLRRNAQGNLVGTQKVRRMVNLDETGSSFTGSFQNEILDLEGNVERSSTGTVQGARIVAEPFV